MTLYIKKVWSVGPTKSFFMPLDKALKAYERYCNAVIKMAQKFPFKKETVKSFKVWARTEIWESPPIRKGKK